MYFLADYLWTKEIMNYIFITTKECYSISIICYRVPTRVL